MKSTIMIFGVAQVTAFFEDNDQMGLSHITRLHLHYEGIVRPEDLIDFTELGNAWDRKSVP